MIIKTESDLAYHVRGAIEARKLAATHRQANRSFLALKIEQVARFHENAVRTYADAIERTARCNHAFGERLQAT